MSSRAKVRQRNERGAVLILVGIAMTTLLTFTAIAIDLGYQRVVRRDMQALADVVALDMVRLVDGRSVAAIEADPAWLEARDDSVARNDDTQGEPPVVTPVLGEVNPDTRAFTALTGTAVPNAVKVTAEADVDYFFRPGSSSATRSAIAGGGDKNACFSIGSFALGLETANSPLLNAMLADALNIGVLSYDGLVSSEITLFDLAAELGVGSADELATTSIALDDFYLAVAEVLDRQGDTANAQLLESIAIAMTGSTVVQVGDIVGLEQPGSDSALGAIVNVLDLVATGAFVANGTNAIQVPTSTVNALGLVNLTSQAINIVEAPRIGCGDVGTSLETSQVSLGLSGQLLNLPLSVAGLINATVDINLDVDLVQAAQGLATITDILCGDVEGLDLDVATALVQAGIGLDITVSAQLLPILPVIDLLRLPSANAGTAANETVTPVEFVIPPDAYNDPKEVGSALDVSGLGVSFGTPVLLGLPVALLQPVLSALLSQIVNPLLQSLQLNLVGPLLDLLGINLAGADVAAIPRHPSTACTSPVSLVG